MVLHKLDEKRLDFAKVLLKIGLIYVYDFLRQYIWFRTMHDFKIHSFFKKEKNWAEAEIFLILSRRLFLFCCPEVWKEFVKQSFESLILRFLSEDKNGMWTYLCILVLGLIRQNQGNNLVLHHITLIFRRVAEYRRMHWLDSQRNRLRDWQRRLLVFWWDHFCKRKTQIE